ncbi:MAG: ECF transporter S component [Prevotella sp.]|nr:ECF transporter S component [Prevotella sp.]
MTTDTKLTTLGYSDVRTYAWAVLFVGCNMLVPQLFHLIPQGGIIFAPLSLVILVAAYRFGWLTGLLAAVASPVANHLAFGMPAAGVMGLMALKLSVLAVVAGLVARRTGRATMVLLAGVVLAAELIGGAGEWLLTGGLTATIADFTIGWPGLLLQVVGGYVLINLRKDAME